MWRAPTASARLRSRARAGGPITARAAARCERRRAAMTGPTTHAEEHGAFTADYLATLGVQIRKCRYFTVNNLNRDFVGTRGFSVVFRREGLARVEAEFPFFGPYLGKALRADCNA